MLSSRLFANASETQSSASAEKDDLDDVRGATEEKTKKRQKNDASTPTTPSLVRLDWHDFDPAGLASIRADAVVAADVLYDPTDVSALLDVTAALLGRRRKKKRDARRGVEATS